jgi:hypothetical protein
MTTDRQGMIGLGELKNITEVRADFRSNECNFSETWTIINQEKDSWTQSKDIHIVEGENIEIPVNFDDSKPLLPTEASLAMFQGDNVLTNLFKRIKLAKVPCGKYHMLSLEGLEAGSYKLCTKMCANEFQEIEITVHKGEYWEGTFILKKNCMFQSSAQKNMVRIDEVTH